MKVENGVLLEVTNKDIIDGKFEFPEGITSIGSMAFSDCNSLTKIDIPEGVTTIRDYTFDGCNNLTEVSVPYGVIKIGIGAFRGCKNLRRMQIPNTVIYIRQRAFEGCTNLTKIQISDIVANIGDSAFIECSNLKQVEYQNRVLEMISDTINIKLNKYGLIILTVDGVNTLLKDQKDLIKLGVIDKNLIQKQKDEQEKTLKGQLEAIYNNINLKISREYNQEHEINYLNKMINVIGLNETENLLKIPKGVSIEDIQNYGEKLLEVYEPKNKLNGNLSLVMLMLDNIDTAISEESKDARNDRNKFYTKFNELLESSNNNLNLEELLSSCASEIGLDLKQTQIQKIKRELQTIQLTEKSDEIKSKLQEKINNPELGIIQTGVSSTLIYNVIKQNILNGGKLEDIEEIFEQEINRTTREGTRYYGASIQNQKDKLKQAIEELYAENSELLNSNMVDILKDTKHKIGDRWILRLKNSKNNIRDLQSMTEEEKNTLIKNLEKNEINIPLNFSKKYELKQNISPEQAIEILSQEQFPEILTYEKAEMIFSNMKEPASEKFRTWFVENKKEIMRNSEYYTRVSTLHNEFEAMLQDPITNATYENKELTPELAFNILNAIEKEGRSGNEELSRLASSVNISSEEFTTAQDIFEVTKKRERSYIPTVKTDRNRYRGRILRADDPMNILVGNATNCCQKVGAPGASSMVHASTEDNGRIFVVEELDENGEVVKPVAQSWVWRNKDTVCFDNIEIPTSEQSKLRTEDGDKKAQQEILEIYKECAKNMVKQDEKMLGKLLKDGKITGEMYNQIVVKTVTVGTGNNDLGILKKVGLEAVPVKNLVLPREKDKDYNGDTLFVDSGRDSVTGVGAQLYLVKGETKENTSKGTKQYDLEDLPVKPMYHNEREVRKLKGRTIDKGVVNALKQIEDKVFGDRQKLLGECEDYKGLAETYNIAENDIQVHISREKDWYVIFKDNEEELYIADLGMVNGINSESRGKEKTDVIQQTLEIEESMYKLMLNAEEEQKPIRLEATEDTSYINIVKLAKRGLVHVEEDNKRDWSNRREIQMHDMKITVNKEKMQEELKKVQERLAKKREEALFRKVEDKDAEGR